MQQQVTWALPFAVRLSLVSALTMAFATLIEGPYVHQPLVRGGLWIGAGSALGIFLHRLNHQPASRIDVPQAGKVASFEWQPIGTVKSLVRDQAQRGSLVERPPRGGQAPRPVQERSPHGSRLHLDRIAASRVAADFRVEPAGHLGTSSLPYAVTKRTFDVILAVVLAAALIPLIPLIGLAIRLDSPGPIFYSQDRVGRHARVFRIHKFRSMSTDAERHGAVWAQESDPRVTRVGRFMRRARLDELPQLWNVIRGDMTFVGPRPERPEFTGILESELPAYGYRHVVKPGLTGWAQIRYRYASSVQDAGKKLEYDLYYVKHRSILFDVRILFLTIPVILNLRGW